MKQVLKLAALAACFMAPAAPALAETNWTGISVGVGIGAGAMVNELQLGPGTLLPPSIFSWHFAPAWHIFVEL
jgi:opacity protein-like surface antigen